MSARAELAVPWAWKLKLKITRASESNWQVGLSWISKADFDFCFCFLQIGFLRARNFSALIDPIPSLSGLTGINE